MGSVLAMKSVGLNGLQILHYFALRVALVLVAAIIFKWSITRLPLA